MMKTIDGTKLDSQFKYDVAAWPGGENVTMCYSCGTCTAACPASDVNAEFNPRKIIRQVLLGMRAEVLGSPLLWECIQCYACTSQCPQNVKFRDVMRVLREMAVAEGFAPSEMIDQAKQLGTFTIEMRQKLIAQALAGGDACEKTKAKIEKVLE